MIKKNPALLLAVILTVLFLILSFVKIGFLESLELAIYDLRMDFRAAGPETRTDIVVVDIDDDSIAKLGRWPWPRTRLAQMIDKLKSYGAKIIGLNILLSEEQRGEGMEVIGGLKKDFDEMFKDLSDPRVNQFMQKLTEAQNSLDSDRILAESIARAKDVVLPVFFTVGTFPKPDPNLPMVIKKNGLIHATDIKPEFMIPAKKITAPIPRFADKAVGLGHVNSISDEDGAVRREVLLYDYLGLPFPSLALRLAVLSQDLPLDNVNILTDERDGRTGIKMANTIVPTSPDMSYFMTFTDAKAFQNVSFFDVLNDKVEKTLFKDKIVLIGVSATGIDVPRVTPIDKKMSTSLITANALQNLLTGNYITRSGMMDLIEWLVLLAVGFYLSGLLPRLKARTGALASVGLLVVIIVVGIYLFVGPGVWYKVTYPILLTVIGYAAVTTTRYFVTEVIKDKAEGESAEVNRMLGLSFQSQGQLDMAFDKFRRVPVDDGMKDILYNLALDYERKRMFNKAVSVYEYIRDYDAEYKDIPQKIKKLTVASETLIFGLGTGARHAEDGTLVMDETTRPTLGRYEIVKELGKGAMGVVYMGRDPQIGREMAIKTIRFTEEYEDDEAEKVKDQFFTEAKTAGMLSHPHIVTIYDAGTDHDLSFIAMEFLEGHDLKDHTTPDKLLPIREVIRIVADVADALGYAHQKGVVHRDIKPANIMLLKSGVAKVTDFGIARAMASSKTKTGVVKGTPFYMSPEQITGKKVDGRSDIYSLGVVLYELLSGVQPFRADDLTALIYKITSEDPEPVSQHNAKVPKAVVQIIEKALTKDREKRYQKGEQMAEHLRIVGRKMDELTAKKTGGLT